MTAKPAKGGLAERAGAAARAVPPQGMGLVAKSVLYPVVAAILSSLIAAFVTSDGRPAMGYFLPLWLVLVGALVLVMLAAWAAERLRGRRLPGLRPALVVVVIVAAGFALTQLASVHQRCVSRSTMTVVASSLCQSPDGANSGGTRPYVWYYGGDGTRIGDSVRGGSLTPPPNVDDDGGSHGTGDGDDGDGGGFDGGGGDR